jgi:hypothetical protein
MRNVLYLLLVVSAASSCVGEIQVPIAPTAGSSNGESSEGASSPKWCAPGTQEPTAELVINLADPNDGYRSRVDIPMVACPQDKATFGSEPMSCVSGDSFNPRSWSNSCVSLRASTDSSATADIDVSWHLSSGQGGSCQLSVVVPFTEVFRQSLPCGLTLEVHFHPIEGRSNNGLQPTARGVESPSGLRPLARRG